MTGGTDPAWDDPARHRPDEPTGTPAGDNGDTAGGAGPSARGTGSSAGGTGPSAVDQGHSAGGRGHSASNGTGTLTVAQQRQLVETQRAELGRTIAALADKVDVPARAKAAAASARQRLGARTRRYADPEYLLAAVAGICTAVSVVAFTAWWRRGRQVG